MQLPEVRVKKEQSDVFEGFFSPNGMKFREQLYVVSIEQVF